MAFDGGLLHVIFRLCELSTVIETEFGGWLGTNKEKRERVKMVNDFVKTWMHLGYHAGSQAPHHNIMKETIQMWLRNAIGRRKPVGNLKGMVNMNLEKYKDKSSH